jgi:hypothetical protein
MAKQPKAGAPEQAPGKLPKAAIALTTLIASRDEHGQLRGPITAFMQLKSDADALLELNEGDGEKFFALEILRELSAEVVARYEQAWKLLDLIDKGELTKAGAKALAAKKQAEAEQAAKKDSTPKIVRDEVAPATPEQGKANVDHADVGGTNESNEPLGRDVPQARV